MSEQTEHLGIVLEEGWIHGEYLIPVLMSVFSRAQVQQAFTDIDNHSCRHWNCGSGHCYYLSVLDLSQEKEGSRLVALFGPTYYQFLLSWGLLGVRDLFAFDTVPPYSFTHLLTHSSVKQDLDTLDDVL